MSLGVALKLLESPMVFFSPIVLDIQAWSEVEVGELYEEDAWP
jgi:hypothetical protein